MMTVEGGFHGIRHQSKQHRVRSFAERIMPIDWAVADEWGRMSAKRIFRLKFSLSALRATK
jgi:hypothetical protein